ncbi:uncharacterized protein VICG_01244, partial [Vittaforma corneae ATCC 50505]
ETSLTMGSEAQPGVRWSAFKILITLILMGLAGYCIYMAFEPIVVESDYSLKSWVSLIFAALMVFFIFSIFKVHRNYQFVFWACSFGMFIFVSFMFFNYDSLFD